MVLECPICNEYYNTGTRIPVVLTCGHTLCQVCAKNLRTRKCPTCREDFARYSKNYSLATLVQKPRQLSDYQTLFKICIIGQSGVGKTSIFNSFVGGQFQENMQSTIGLGFRYVSEEIDGKVYKFEMWDTGGQEKYRAMTSTYYKNSDLIIITYSLSDIDSFKQATQYWIEEVMQTSPASKILLLGNKVDEKTDKLNRKNIIPEEYIENMCAKLGCLNAKVSCKTGVNMRSTWRLITETLIREFSGRQSLNNAVRLQNTNVGRSKENSCRC